MPTRFCYDGDVAKIEHIRHPNRLLWQLIAGTAFLILIGVLVYFLFFASVKRPFPVPGSSMNSFAAENAASAETRFVVDHAVTSSLDERLKANLKTSFGLRTWYQQENRELAIPAAQSAELSAAEQLLYGAWLVEQGKKSEFQLWLSEFRAAFASPEGLVYAKRKLAADSAAQLALAEPASSSWPDTLLYIRVLAMAYSRWPQKDLDRAEHAVVQTLGRAIGDSLVADSHAVIPRLLQPSIQGRHRHRIRPPHRHRNHNRRPSRLSGCSHWTC